ncbi:tyrosine-type recombinase/integrase [Chromobacterium sp. Beijing]|uniref:tyrosine-type recombinase/integrase n=1 Tax=Chromobacterium sp. Beijing TaxID=2735795 RepID=UPI001F2963B7|nr:tyrosine-type recombinase/integrase [Chromobacterium sp. Beijing]UJB31361.1 tyrosine-type recombinase/integrase [Chromobacterium sp. Beijing]
MSSVSKLQTSIDFGARSIEPAFNTKVLTWSGSTVDTSGKKWRISARRTLNWELIPLRPGTTLQATLAYFRNCLRQLSDDTIFGKFKSLKTIFGTAIEANFDISNAIKIDMSFYEAIRNCLLKKVSPNTVRSHLQTYRNWYLWCTDAELEGFNEEVATVLENRIIGGNIKGAAVLRNDPNEGPLHKIQFDVLTARLRQAEESHTLSIEVLAAAWLFITYGTNTRNMLLLNEEDLIKTRLIDGSEVYELRIPRIKKRQQQERTDFKTRALPPGIGQLLEKLKQQNARQRRLALLDHNPTRFTQPMFRRKKPYAELLDTEFAAEAYRQPSFWFNIVLAHVVDKLGLKSADGEPLRLSPRRLRYTFATRLVQEGASPMELAEALDHTDLQHVMVYFNTRSDAVVRLDSVLTLPLTPIAQAFMGMVVPDENQAKRGDDPASRIKFLNREQHQLKTVGTCSSFGFCELAAPIACYTCFKFQPWLDAPHQDVLDWLVSEREKHLARGVDPKMTQIHDTTLRAVNEVIHLCQTIRHNTGDMP